MPIQRPTNPNISYPLCISSSGSTDSFSIEALEHAYESLMRCSEYHRETEAVWRDTPQEEQKQILQEEQDMDIIEFKNSKELFKTKNKKYLSKIIDIVNKSILYGRIEEYNPTIDQIKKFTRAMLNLNNKVHILKDRIILSDHKETEDTEGRMIDIIEETKSLYMFLSSLNDLFNQKHKEFTRHRPCDIDIIGNITALKDTATIEYCNNSVSFIYRTDHIILEYNEYEISLGEFDISVNYSNCNRPEIQAYAVDPNPSENGGYEHPHIADGVICMGEAANKIYYMLKNCMFTDLFDVLEILLNTYNPNSPYRTIEEWSTEYKCSECGISMTSNQYRACLHCRELLCDDCITLTDDYKSPFCSICAKDHYCEICNRYMKEVGILDCCEKITCRECIAEESIKCRVCGNQIHTECAVLCSECDFLVCDDCLITYNDKDMCMNCAEKKKKEEEENGKEEE